MHNPHLPTHSHKKSGQGECRRIVSSMSTVSQRLDLSKNTSMQLDESIEENEPGSLGGSMISKQSIRSILKPNHSRLEPSQLSESDRHEKKNIRFSQTQVHLVENWKQFNKPKRSCCYSFFFN